MLSDTEVDLFDSLGLAAMVLDDNSRLQVANILATRLIDSGALSVTNGVLRATDPGDRAKLAAALAMRDDSLPGGRIVALRVNHERRPLFLRLVRRRHLPGSVLIVVSDPDALDRICPACLRHVFDLTGREADLVVLLAAGRSLEDAAEALRMTIGTARTHLRHVFQKVNTASQVDLVRLVLSASLGRCPSERSPETPQTCPTCQ